MNQAEEDALINGIEIEAKKVAADLTVKNIDPRAIMRDAIRLAIRAAVAHERERAAKVCDELHKQWQGGEVAADEYLSPIDCAAAIRRGE